MFETNLNAYFERGWYEQFIFYQHCKMLNTKSVVIFFSEKKGKYSFTANRGYFFPHALGYVIMPFCCGHIVLIE